MNLLLNELANIFLATESHSVVPSTDMDLPPTAIISAAVILASAIAILYKRADASHKKCEERGLVQDAKIDALGERLTSILSGIIVENSAAQNRISLKLKELTKSVRESSGEHAPPEEESTAVYPAIRLHPHDHA